MEMEGFDYRVWSNQIKFIGRMKLEGEVMLKKEGRKNKEEKF